MHEKEVRVRFHLIFMGVLMKSRLELIGVDHLSAEAVGRRCSVKKRPEVCRFIKKSFWRRCFPVSFAKFLRTPFFIEHL